MNKERKLEIYTERLHRLAFDLALQASKSGPNGKGIAVVADETRTIAIKLYAFLEQENTQDLPAAMLDALLQIEFLSFNGWLEMLRIGIDFDHDNMVRIPGPLAVILDEIKNVANDIRCLFGLKDNSGILPQPELKKESRVSNAKLFLLQATIGGEPFVENTAYVDEVHTYIDGDPHFGIQDGFYQVRGTKIPVVDCYARFGLDRSRIKKTAGGSCMLIIESIWEKEPARYGVLVDALPQTFGFFSRFSEGESTCSRSKVFTSPHVRACWDTVDDGQMIFLDWKSLA